jgi:hypothetical protein
VAGGEAGGLGQAGPNRLLKSLGCVGGKLTQLCYSRVVIEGVGGKRHRSDDQLVGQGGSHGFARYRSGAGWQARRA